MDKNTETISLAGKDYPVGNPLSIQQLIDVRVIALDQTPAIGASGRLSGQDWKTLLEHKAAVVAAALPEMTQADILALRATEDELQAAYAAVIHKAGLKLAGEEKPAPGEAKPAA